ncbi:hypothetical protein BDV59DRAFT_59085 [Aspergillus ambiguus]|uniref:uncharacterized protein n=1 Tax=Aspergillus ambiguus TaxID=176160 RepID=UPI003CCD9A80
MCDNRGILLLEFNVALGILVHVVTAVRWVSQGSPVWYLIGTENYFVHMSSHQERNPTHPRFYDALQLSPPIGFA